MNFAKSAPIPAKLTSDMRLKHRNTFGLEAVAEFAYDITAAEQLPALLKSLAERKVPWRVLGGGSNVLLPAQLSGATLLMNILGQEIIPSGDSDADGDGEDKNKENTLLAVGAGVNWHALVAWTLEHDLPGLENLALIPGTVGAAPIQNIGAYGVEVGQYIDSIKAFDTVHHAFVTLSQTACQFGYRDSLFKQHPHRFIVTQVIFKIPQQWQARTHYAELATQFSDSHSQPTAQQICDAVCSIRTKKLPDPQIIGNAGSFFQNPIVTQAQYASLLSQYPNLVSYPDKLGARKLAAGWLIDQCGFKGLRIGAVGVYEKQALVLVNYGGASAVDILNLAKAIQEKVRQQYGVQLAIEPNIF